MNLKNTDNNLPQHGVLMLQPKCNMACSFCVTEDSMQTMSFEIAQKLLSDFRDREFTSVIFGGGEPFFWPHDLKKIIMYAKELGLKTQLGTNTIKLPENLQEWAFVDRWVIPLDGVSEKTHNTLRPYQGRHLQIVTEALQKLKAAGHSVTVSTVVTQVNQQEVNQVGEHLRGLQDSAQKFIHAWHIFKFLPFGRGGKLHQSELEVSNTDYENIIIKAREQKLPFKVFKRKDMLLSKTVEFYWVENQKIMLQSKAKGLQIYNSKS